MGSGGSGISACEVGGDGTCGVSCSSVTAEKKEGEGEGEGEGELECKAHVSDLHAHSQCRIQRNR